MCITSAAPPSDPRVFASWVGGRLRRRSRRHEARRSLVAHLRCAPRRATRSLAPPADLADPLRTPEGAALAKVNLDVSMETSNRLPGDTCDRDWIWEREIEAAAWEDVRRISVGAWERQYRRLRERSPFYAGKWREAGIGNSFVSLADLSRLPFTTKQELKEALDADPPFGSNLCAEPDQVKRVYQTSGTTGSPSVLALTRADMESWTTMGTRSYYATGIHEHSSVLTTFGAGPFVAGHTHFVLLRIGARSVPVAPGDTERVTFGLRAGLADTLLATASFAQYLANRLEQSEAEPSAIPLSHVVTGGEPGGGIPAIRDHIQRVLGVTVTEVMGIGDIAPSLFGECTHQQGMHF